MIGKIKGFGAAGLAWALPMLALAQSARVDDGYVFDALDLVKTVISAYLIPIVIGLAVLAFIWGLLKYIIAKDDTAKSEARGVMIYGIIAIFVMVSIWGLVGLLQDVTGVDEENPPPAPGIPEAY